MGEREQEWGGENREGRRGGEEGGENREGRRESRSREERIGRAGEVERREDFDIM